MPTEGSDEVADDYVATETPVDGSEAAGEAEGVEENLPPTVDPVAEEPRSWADLSEGSTAPAPSGELELTQVKGRGSRGRVAQRGPFCNWCSGGGR